MLTLHQLLKAAIQQDASDLHLVAGSPPALRVNGQIVRVKTTDLKPEQTRQLCYSVLTDYQKSRFEEDKELDFSFGVKNMARFRSNLFFQRSAVSGVFRRIPISIPNHHDLGLPKSATSLTRLPYGLVLVTGPTGSGKSTTIAALVDKVNEERWGHIISLEDPIEFIHNHKKSIVNQREIGSDTNSYRVAMKYLLRQDPDVCVIGELRDLETIETALQIAETGHLVFATLHTNSAVQTVSRLVSVFPAEQQERIRVMLSFVLQGVVSQKLIKTLAGGRAGVYEILLLTPSIRNLIRENKLHQVYGMMQIGQERTGMSTMNQALLNLVLRRKIDTNTAIENATDADEMGALLEKAGI